MKITFSKASILVLLLFVIFAPIVFGADVPTGASISNFSPAFSVTPSDGGSSSSAPTNVASNVTFTATAKDVNSDQYYLAICKTNAVTAGANTYPTCTGGKWPAANPTAFNSDAVATETYSVQTSISHSNDWYAFVCDKLASGAACHPANGSGDQGKALGIITFSGVPVDGATLTIDSIVYEFDTANNGVTGGRTEVDTSASVNGSGAATKLAQVEAGTSSSMLNRAPYVYVYADAAGVSGNSIGMAEAGDSGSAITLSGANLAGGSAANASPFFANFLTSIAITDNGGYTNDSTPVITVTKSGGTPTHIQFSCDGTNWSSNIAYQVDNTFNDLANDFNITSGATNCSATNGSKTIYARLYDGTYGLSVSDTTSYDNVAPTTTGAITGGTLGSNDWYTTNVTYTLTPADATSGVASTVYCTDTANSCTPGTSYTVALTLSTESATNYVRWASTDNAGNVQTTQSSGAIKIDKTAPAVTAITSVAGDTSAPYYDTTNEAPNTTAVVYTASSDATACKWDASDVAYASMANTCASTSSCTLNLTGEGAKTVYMRCLDGAGLMSATSYTLNYTLDFSPPAVTAITSVAGDTAATYYDTTDNSSTAVVYTASADAVTCRWNTTDVAYASMTNTCASTSSCILNLSGDGAKTVYMRCIDSGGLSSTTSWTLNYTIDSVAPTTSGGITAGTAGTNGWYTSDVTYTLTPADATSGVATTLYCVDTANSCSPSLTYSVALTLSTESATNYVRWASTDNAGNVQTTQTSGAIKIDKTAPAVTAITSVAGDTSAPYYDTTDNSSTAVVYTASADATACKWNTTDVVYSSMANTCASTSSCTLNLAGDGSKTVYLRCTDDAGNVSASSWTLSYIIDSTAPSITAFTATATSTTQVSLDPTANDGTGIGMHATPYDYRMLAGASCGAGTTSGFIATDPYTWTTLSANTQYSFDVRAKDALDNTSSYAMCTTKYSWANQPTTAGHGSQTTTNVNYTWAAPGTGAPVTYGYAYGTTTSCVDGTVTTLFKSFTSTANTQIPLNYICSINEDNIKNTTSPLAIGPFYTDANTPGAPTCGTSTATTLAVAPAAMTPAGTEVAIRINGGSYTNQYIQTDGTVGASAVWATQAVWSTKTVTGLAIGTSYTFDVKARNGNNDETAFGTSASCYSDRAPSFTADPSDGGSTAAAPTNVGANVAFTATATDDESHQYYLAICKTNAITAGSNAAPTCTGGSWAISAATNSASQASVNYTALQGDVQSNAWYAFVCDKNTNGLGACSSMSQGSANPSPFNVNHAPVIGTVTDGNTYGTNSEITPGNGTGGQVFFQIGVTDPDNDTVQDTIDYYICNSATTAFDPDGSPGYCTDGTLIGSGTGISTGTNAQNNTNTLVPIPTAHNASIAYKIYLKDSHSFTDGGTGGSYSYAVQDVAPTVTAYTVDTLVPQAGVSTAYTFDVAVSDNNGGNDVTSVDGLIYDDYAVNLSSGTCTSNEQNCYLRPTCSLGTPSGANVTATCSGITTWFNINPTQSPGTALWKAHANPSDGGGAVTNAGDSNPFTVNAISSLGIPEPSIDYSALGVGALSSQKSVTIQNAGNVVSDAFISGTDMTSGANTMGRAQQHWSGSSGFGYASGYAMVESATNASPATGCFNANVAVRTAHASGSTDSAVYWLLLVPDSQVSGSYSGSNTIAEGTCL
jgi:hypothetical protein